MEGAHGSEARSLMAEIRARHPGFREAVLADARVTAAFRGERSQFSSTTDALAQILRLAWASDAFLAPYHIDRGKIYGRHRGKLINYLDCERIAKAIEQTRFPIPVGDD